jgi:hypothetical protein
MTMGRRLDVQHVQYCSGQSELRNHNDAVAYLTGNNAEQSLAEFDVGESHTCAPAGTLWSRHE